MNFLQPSVTKFDKLINIAAGFFVILLWITFLSNLFSFTYNYRADILFAQLYSQQPSQLFVFLMSVILAPLWEELVFRQSVLQIIRDSKYVLWVTIIVSAIFGALHNNTYYHYGIYFQGVTGFVFACVYIKNGYSYWSSVTLHAMWNGSIMLLPHLR